MIYASFSIAECHHLNCKSILEKMATGQPDCPSEVALAQLEAFILTIREIEEFTAELAMSFFIFLNALMVEQDKGKVDTCINGVFFFLKMQPIGSSGQTC